MNIVTISPHLDDAVLSLGQFLAGVARSVVVTVFAGIPEHGLSEYDRSCGFTSSSEAMRARRAEDISACRSLNAEAVHLDFLDQQYGTPADDAAISAALLPFYRSDWLILVPLGIGHPDHVQVARCARDARPEGTLIAYEEAPYRVLWPEQAADVLDKIRAEGWAVADLPYPLEVGARACKVRALAEYKSQFPTVEAASEPAILVPERAWRIAR